MYKDVEKQKQYYREYYKKNKEKYAYSKVLNYWRKKAREICADEQQIMGMSLNSLRSLCNGVETN